MIRIVYRKGIVIKTHYYQDEVSAYQDLKAERNNGFRAIVIQSH